MNYLVGDSHLRFLKKLIDARRPDSPEYAVYSNHAQNFRDIDVVSKAGVVRGICKHRAGKKPVELKLCEGDKMVLSAPLHSSQFSRHKMWHKHAPWAMMEEMPDAIPVSNNIFDMLAESRSKSVVNFLKAGKKIGAKVAVIEPPYLPRRVIDDSGLSEQMIAHCDKAYRSAARRYINAAGIDVISTPLQTHDGDFLLEEFQAGSETDMHHGNPDYAKLVADDVLGFFDKTD